MTIVVGLKKSVVNRCPARLVAKIHEKTIGDYFRSAITVGLMIGDSRRNRRCPASWWVQGRDRGWATFSTERGAVHAVGRSGEASHGA